MRTHNLKMIPGAWRGGVYQSGELKSKYRGLSHELFLLVIPVYGYFLIAASQSIRALVSSSVFLFCLTWCFACSSQYHRRTWSRVNEYRMQRMDHIGIALVCAGGATPLCLLLLVDVIGVPVLSCVWTICVASISHTLFKKLQYKQHWIGIALYAAIGLPVVAIMYQVYDASPMVFVLVLASWMQCLIGIAVYVNQWCDFVPDTFGYHEVFHLCIIGGQVTTCIATYYITVSR